MSDIFREVEEDLRRDQMAAVWKNYGPYILAACVMVIIGTAAMVGYRSWQNNRAEEYSEKFLAVQKMSEAQAIEAYAALAKDANQGYRTLATFDQAALLVRAGKGSQAVEVYENFAQESDDEIWAELARLQAARLLLDQSNFEDMRARLEPLIREDGAWRVGARELLAFAALRAGDAQRARNLMEENLRDSGLTAGVRNRAEQILAALRPVTMAPATPVAGEAANK